MKRPPLTAAEHSEANAARLWKQLAALAAIYGTVADAAPLPWHVTIAPWTIRADIHNRIVAVEWNDWIAGEIGADYAEVYAPGIEDAAGRLRHALAHHVYQHRNSAEKPEAASGPNVNILRRVS